MGIEPALWRILGIWNLSAALKEVSRSIGRYAIQGAHLLIYDRRKRAFPSESFSPPRSSIEIWSHLLGHLQSRHRMFSAVLISRIIGYLSHTDTSSDEGSRPDVSAEMCLARWAFWIVNFSENNSETDLRRDVVVALLNSLGPGLSGTASNKTT